MADFSDKAATAALLRPLRETNVTATTHSERYPAILPTRPELSQKGRTVLITGGGTGIGLAIAKAFIQASAKMVIVAGRRKDVLQDAVAELQQVAKEANIDTEISSRVCDITNVKDVESVWADFATAGLTVDVLVANAARFTEPQPIFELGADEIWAQVEANVKGPLYFTEKFQAQPGDGKKFVVNVSTESIHLMAHPGVAIRPGYTLSKMAGTLLHQVIAQNVPAQQLQIVSFHPGLIYNPMWEKMGLGPEWFDDESLCSAFAVWAASDQAEFLHGRFVWAAWDVEELAAGELRQRIADEPYFLKCSIVGLNGALKA